MGIIPLHQSQQPLCTQGEWSFSSLNRPLVLRVRSHCGFRQSRDGVLALTVAIGKAQDILVHLTLEILLCPDALVGESRQHVSVVFGF